MFGRTMAVLVATLALGCEPDPRCATLADGCPCPRLGDIRCGSIGTYQCGPDGRWTYWDLSYCGGADIPYMPVDCSSDPHQPGCPCDCRDERYCEGETALYCLEGTRWIGVAGCTPGPSCSP